MQFYLKETDFFSLKKVIFLYTLLNHYIYIYIYIYSYSDAESSAGIY